MAQAAAPAGNATAADAFIEYSEYKGYTIIVPKQFSPDDSKLLMKLQVLAINARAVSGVKKDTIVNTAAWTTEGQPCVHINFCPVLRDAFDYSAFLPLSLVEKCGRIVAGVCVTSLAQCRQLSQQVKSLPLDLDTSLVLLLKRLWPKRNTNLVHSDRQGTSDRSPSTTSAICSPSTLTTTTEAREGSLGEITRRRRRDSKEPDDYAAEAPEWKRARTTSSARPSSGSVLIQPTFSSTSAVSDRKDIIHAPTAEIENLNPLSASTSKADMMAYLKVDNKTHRLLLTEAHQARGSICQLRGHPSWKDLPEEVRHEATLGMVKNASTKTKPYYEKGKWLNNGKEGNWVAWWYFYQCIRYKNNSQRKSNKPIASATQDSTRGDYQFLIEDIQGGYHFPNHQTCRELDLKWEEKLNWQDVQSPFRPTITSSSIPTVVSDLWIDPGFRVESSADAQCGNSMFLEVQQGWTNPILVESYIGVLEQAYPSGYLY